jgi:hypothetical protein
VSQISPTDFGDGLAATTSLVQRLNDMLPETVEDLCGQLVAASEIVKLMRAVFPTAKPAEMLAKLKEAAESPAMQDVIIQLLVAKKTVSVAR